MVVLPIQTRDIQLPPHQTLVQVEAQLMVVHLIFMAVAVAVAPAVLVILVRITVLVELVSQARSPEPVLTMAVAVVARSMVAQPYGQVLAVSVAEVRGLTMSLVRRAEPTDSAVVVVLITLARMAVVQVDLVPSSFVTPLNSQ